MTGSTTIGILAKSLKRDNLFRLHVSLGFIYTKNHGETFENRSLLLNLPPSPTAVAYASADAKAMAGQDVASRG
jgi:hypothetical protein